jgi:hypothetical protein
MLGVTEVKPLIGRSGIARTSMLTSDDDRLAAL